MLIIRLLVLFLFVSPFLKASQSDGGSKESWESASSASSSSTRKELHTEEDEPFIFDQSLEAIGKSCVQDCLQELNNLSSGIRLLSTLKEVLREKGKQLMFQKNNKDATAFIYGSLSVNIKPEQLNTSQVSCVGRKIFLVRELPFKSYEEKEVFEIGRASSPNYAVLGHELIHVIDYLKNSNTYIDLFEGYDVKECLARNEDCWATLQRVRKFPPDQYSKRGSSKKIDEILWTKLKEQRTVIGYQGCKEQEFVTELDLRFDGGLSPRYAYQRAEDNFFEDAKVIESILSNFWGKDWGKILNNLERPDWSFDPKEALHSRYNFTDFSRYQVYPCSYKEYQSQKRVHHKKVLKENLEGLCRKLAKQNPKSKKHKILSSMIQNIERKLQAY